MNFLSPLFECMIIIFISKAYTRRKLNINKIIFLSIIVLIDMVTINYLIHDKLIAMTLFGQLVFLIICSLFEDRLFKKILLLFISTITSLILEIVSAIIVSIIHLAIQNPEILELTGNLVTIALSLILVFTPVYKIYNIITSTRFSYKIALIYSYFIVISVIIIAKMNIQFLYRHIYVYIIFIMFLILCNLLLLYYERVILAKEHELQSYLKNQPIYEELIKDIRSSQHEFSNRIQTLQLLCDSTDNLDDIREKLHDYTNTYGKPLRSYPLLSINMPLFAAALYSLSIKAEAKDIIINFDIISEILVSQASEVLLTDLSCILLQNAIDASYPKDNIYVNIKSDNKYTEIEIRNAVLKYYSHEETNKFFTYGYSSKNTATTASHGMGLYYLKKEILKYNDSDLYVDCLEHEGRYWIIFKIKL